MRNYSVSIAGRVKNSPLKKHEALVPLFEAIVNSIQAIEDTREDNRHGEITVTVDRLETLDAEDLPHGEIMGFTIVDNGVGFDETNFQSFLESDSRLKEDRGGRGVGRISWLKAFDSAHVESTYLEGEECYRRVFDFTANAAGIDDVVKSVLEKTHGASVQLRNVKREYLRFIPDSVDDIADAVMQHCLVYLLEENCPKISIIDDERLIVVNELLKDLLESESKTEQFIIRKQEFSLLHIKLHVNAGCNRKPPASKLILCANMRSVEERQLEKYLNGLAPWLLSEHEFVYVGVLTSDYLDDNVDATRTSFDLPQSGTNLVFDISVEEIVQTAQAKVDDFLKDYFDIACAQTRERVEQYVTNKAPQYRHLLTYSVDEIEAIKFGSDEEAIDDALYKANRKFEKSIKADSTKLMKRLENGIVNTADYEDEFRRYVERASDANKAALANYVVHRKVIIDLFEQGLYRQDDDKFQKESYIHELIYPMRSSSDNTAYSAHNLWLIDERLTYSTYISSDEPFGGKNGADRPDLLCLQSPVFMATEENCGDVYDSVILFELKRPMRNNYDEKDNPIAQLLGYAEQIKSGKTLDANGRPIRVNDNTRMYLYAVCDITPKLETILKGRGFTRTADGLGQFWFNAAYNAYVEVLPFDKLVRDSRMRNQAFFRKLGLD